MANRTPYAADFSGIAQGLQTLGTGIANFPIWQRMDQEINQSRNLARDASQNVKDFYKALSVDAANNPETANKLSRHYGDNWQEVLRKQFGKLDPVNLQKDRRGRSIEDNAFYMKKATNLFRGLAEAGLDMPMLAQATLTGAMTPEVMQEYRAQMDMQQKGMQYDELKGLANSDNPEDWDRANKMAFQTGVKIPQHLRDGMDSKAIAETVQGATNDEVDFNKFMAEIENLPMALRDKVMARSDVKEGLKRKRKTDINNRISNWLSDKENETGEAMPTAFSIKLNNPNSSFTELYQLALTELKPQTVEEENALATMIKLRQMDNANTEDELKGHIKELKSRIRLGASGDSELDLAKHKLNAKKAKLDDIKSDQNRLAKVEDSIKSYKKREQVDTKLIAEAAKLKAKIKKGQEVYNNWDKYWDEEKMEMKPSGDTSTFRDARIDIDTIFPEGPPKKMEDAQSRLMDFAKVAYPGSVISFNRKDDGTLIVTANETPLYAISPADGKGVIVRSADVYADVRERGEQFQEGVEGVIKTTFPRVFGGVEEQGGSAEVITINNRGDITRDMLGRTIKRASDGKTVVVTEEMLTNLGI